MHLKDLIRPLFKKSLTLARERLINAEEPVTHGLQAGREGDCGGGGRGVKTNVLLPRQNGNVNSGEIDREREFFFCVYKASKPPQPCETPETRRHSPT